MPPDPYIAGMGKIGKAKVHFTDNTASAVFDEVEILDSGALRASLHQAFKHDDSRSGLGETLVMYYPAHGWIGIESLEPKAYTVWMSDEHEHEHDGESWEVFATCVSAKEAEALALAHVRTFESGNDAVALQDAFDAGMRYATDYGFRKLRFSLARMSEAAEPAAASTT